MTKDKIAAGQLVNDMNGLVAIIIPWRSPASLSTFELYEEIALALVPSGRIYPLEQRTVNMLLLRAEAK